MTRSRSRSQSRIALFLLVLTLAVGGCIIPADERGPGPSPDSPDNPAPASDKSIWSALADRIDKGQIRDTDELLSIVKDLKAAGDVADTTPFSEIFPDMARANALFDTEEKKREITEKLRKL